MRGARRFLLGTLAVVGWWMVSCRDIPAPDDGVLAVGPVRLPSPGLVVGDTMRDSLGVAAAIEVTAYGPDGEPLSPPPVATFVVLDTTAHTAGALLIGDRTGSARVVGTVGGVQTRPVLVRVTLSPDTLVTVAGDSTLHRVTYSLTAGDSIASSGNLNVDVTHIGATPSGVEAVIVKYLIERAPPGTGTTLLLLNGTVASDRDTTDGLGHSTRVARLRLNALSSFVADTALVRATASYRGRVLGTVTFTIIYTKQ